MTNVLITYDLRAPGRDYEKVYDYLKKLPAKRGLESVWFARTEKSAAEIRDDLKKLVDANDRVFVCVVGRWAGLRLMNKAGDWLNGTAS